MGMKYTRFQDIPQFTRAGSWECDYELDQMVLEIDGWVEQEGLQVNPDFQRGHVWSEAKQIAFVEFFLKGGKTARVLYFNHPEWTLGKKSDQFVLVDGLQRYTAVKRFLQNKIPVFGSFFREYTDRPRLISHTFRLNVNELKTRKEVLQWYLDMNSGGVVHTEEELKKVQRLLKQEI
jgi:hypothetical protein